MPPPPLPVLFVGHGATFFTSDARDATHQWMSAHAEQVRQLRPRALLVVSAHFEASPPRVTAAEAPRTVHDHPVRALYGTRYPAPGSPALARRVQELLGAAGRRCVLDEERGWDHGAWVPLSLLAPGADVPLVQLSLEAGGSPQAHGALGEALAPLRHEGVLLVGSGGVTHDQGEFRRGFFSGEPPDGPAADFSRAFDAWVGEVMQGLRGRERTAALARFREHPLARRAHPSDEHFLPLLVVAGAGGEGRAHKLFEGFQHSLSTSAWRIDA